MRNMIDTVTTKGYLKTMNMKDAYKNALSNEKGSQALEYTFVIGAAVAMAGLLTTVISDGGIQSKIAEKIKEVF